MKAARVVLLTLVAGCGSGGGDPARTAEQGSEAHRVDSLPVVSLSEAAYIAAGIEVEAARAETPEQTLEAPGQIEFDPRRVALVTTRTAGRIEQLAAVEGDHVRAGQPVARLYSPAFHTAQTDFLLAVRRAAQLQGTADEAGAVAVLRATRRRLVLLGVSQDEIAGLESGGEPVDYLTLAAPFDGSIIEAHTLPGAAVEAGATLFRVADLSVVDVVAQVPERALPLVRVGQAASVAIGAYPDLRFAGHVERLHDELDPTTRTLGAVIHVPNRSRRLRPGMFATVRFGIRGTVGEPGALGVVVTIPDAALVTDGDARYVFVEVSPRTFERRQVEVASLVPPGSAAATGSRVMVRRGVASGERVAVRGAFTLKSELAKAALAEDEH
jgi:RND family efflux transporter MFP subunit